jgi:hypothetical protein
MNNRHPNIQYANISLSITYLVQIRSPPPYPIPWIEGRDGDGGATQDGRRVVGSQGRRVVGVVPGRGVMGLVWDSLDPVAI